MTGISDVQLSDEEFTNLLEVFRTLALWDQEAKAAALKDAQVESVEPQNAGAPTDKRVIDRLNGMEGLGL